MARRHTGCDASVDARRAECTSIRAQPVNRGAGHGAVAQLLPMTSGPGMQALTGILVYGGQEVQLKATDVLLTVVQHEPAPVREFLLRQQDSTLFRRIVQ